MTPESLYLSESVLSLNDFISIFSIKQNIWGKGGDCFGLGSNSAILKHLSHVCLPSSESSPTVSHYPSSHNFKHCVSIEMIQAPVAIVMVPQAKTLPSILLLLLITAVSSSVQALIMSSESSTGSDR